MTRTLIDVEKAVGPEDRDKAVMAAVKRACLKLSTLGLKRGDRTLRFELADAKTPTARSQ